MSEPPSPIVEEDLTEPNTPTPHAPIKIDLRSRKKKTPTPKATNQDIPEESTPVQDESKPQTLEQAIETVTAEPAPKPPLPAQSAETLKPQAANMHQTRTSPYASWIKQSKKLHLQEKNQNQMHRQARTSYLQSVEQSLTGIDPRQNEEILAISSKSRHGHLIPNVLINEATEQKWTDK